MRGRKGERMGRREGRGEEERAGRREKMRSRGRGRMGRRKGRGRKRKDGEEGRMRCAEKAEG